MKNQIKKPVSALIVLLALLLLASCTNTTSRTGTKTTTDKKPLDPADDNEKMGEIYIVDGETYSKEEFSSVDISGHFLSECRIKIVFSLTALDMKEASESAKRYLDSVKDDRGDKTDEELEAEAKKQGYAYVGEQIFKKELFALFEAAMSEGVYLSCSGDSEAENGVYYPCAVCSFARNAEGSAEDFDPIRDPAFDSYRACLSAIRGKLRSDRIKSVECTEEYRVYTAESPDSAQ